MKIKITIVCFFLFYFNFANAKLVSIATENSKEFLLVSNVVQLLFEQLSFNVSIQQGTQILSFLKHLKVSLIFLSQEIQTKSKFYKMKTQ